MYLQSNEVITTARRKPFGSVFVPIDNPPLYAGPSPNFVLLPGTQKLAL